MRVGEGLRPHSRDVELNSVHSSPPKEEAATQAQADPQQPLPSVPGLPAMSSSGDADQVYSDLDLGQRMAAQEQAELEWEAVLVAEQDEAEEAASKAMGFPLHTRAEAAP